MGKEVVIRINAAAIYFILALTYLLALAMSFFAFILGEIPFHLSHIPIFLMGTGIGYAIIKKTKEKLK